MSGPALVGFSILLAGLFGVRAVIHRRTTGEAAFRAPPTGAAWVGDGLFALGLLAAIAGTVLDLFDVVDPVDALERLPVQATGAVSLIFGGGVALVAQTQMGTSWRAGIDITSRYELVRDGLFGVVRNPFYLGIILATAGLVLMVPSPVAAVGWFAVLLGCEIDVRLVEEPHLAAAHGRCYRDYAAATGRFLPWVGHGLRC